MLSESFSVYHLEYFLLIFVRILGVVAVAPFFGTRGVPVRMRIGLALCIALVVASLIEYTPLEYTTLIGYSLIVLKEGIMGLSVGLVANLCLSIIGLAGMFVDREIGFSMVTAFDSTTGTTSTISASFYNYTVMLIMLCSNMHYFVIRAICDSFYMIPIGKAVYHGEALYQIALRFIQEYFVVGLRIALPIFISITLCNVVLGVMAKTAPQMNMFSVGIELKLILGLLIMFATVMFLPNITHIIYELTETIILDLIRAMA